MKSQIARFKIRKAVAFLLIFLYLRIKYITNPFPTVARIMHIACKVKIEGIVSGMAKWVVEKRNGYTFVNMIQHIY